MIQIGKNKLPREKNKKNHKRTSHKQNDGFVVDKIYFVFNASSLVFYKIKMDFNINPNECVSNIVNTIKSNGSFDQFRRECLSDVDTKVTDSD